MISSQSITNRSPSSTISPQSTSSPSPNPAGPSPRSTTSSKSSPQSTTSSGTSKLRPLLPKPAGFTPPASASPSSGAAGQKSKMDKTTRRANAGSKKGPFTVDGGGGKASTGVNPNPTPNAPNHPRTPANAATPSRQSLSSPSTPMISPRLTQRSSFPYPPNPVSTHPYHIPSQTPGRRSRESSTYTDYSSLTSPNVATLDGGFGSNGGRHAFSPMNSSGLAQYPRQNVQPGMSTTPIEPPPSPWGPSAMQNPFDWIQPAPSIPQWPASDPTDNSSNTTTNSNNNDNGADSIDPAIFDTLAELIKQSQARATSSSSGPFDFMGALESLATTPASPQSSNAPGMPQSLLTRRLQQQQTPNPRHHGAGLGMGDHGGFGSSRMAQPNIPQITQPDASLGVLSTPPQSFNSRFNGNHGPRPTNHTLAGPANGWPLPDRGMVFNETPITTPEGSEHGTNSPVDVSA